MAVVHLLAHFDDEYCEVPLVREGVANGLDQRFLYVADYRSPRLAGRRLAETQAFLASLGVPPDRVVHVGRGTGVLDGSVYRNLPQAAAAVRAAFAAIGPIEQLVVPAWEGGHMDHDMCALMAVRLGGGAPITQFSLYNGPGLWGPLYRAGSPLAENGEVRPMALSSAEWLSWMGGVRYFPSQLKAWSGLWPAMFATYARRGFGVQRLAPERVDGRPHPGRLLYERMFRTPYAEVRAAADAALG